MIAKLLLLSCLIGGVMCAYEVVWDSDMKIADKFFFTPIFFLLGSITWPVAMFFGIKGAYKDWKNGRR